MITIAREITLDDVRESADLSGVPVYFVAPDATDAPCVWVFDPNGADPRHVLARIDVRTEADWSALTGHLPQVTA